MTSSEQPGSFPNVADAAARTGLSCRLSMQLLQVNIAAVQKDQTFSSRFSWARLCRRLLEHDPEKWEPERAA
jgi:hypothetical protein